MPRRFSLGCLMLGVTLFCILCGFLVNYPEELFGYVLLAAALIPTAVICLALVKRSQRRATVLSWSILGAFLALFALPDALNPPAGPTRMFWPYLKIELSSMAIIPPLGSLLVGGGALLAELLQPPKQT